MHRTLRKAAQGCQAALLQESNPAFQAGTGFTRREYAQIFDVFSKAKAAERKKRWREEASQGYFDDFKELRDSGGKVYRSSALISPDAASTLPNEQVLRPDGSGTTLAEESQKSGVSLLCVAFRNGAEDMLASWSKPFSEGPRASHCQHIELSIVESAVMSWWPFKGMILRGRSNEADASAVKPKYYFTFSSLSAFINALQLSNRLTGYVFLIDQRSRIRWRGSGTAEADEVQSMMDSVKAILHEQQQSKLV